MSNKARKPQKAGFPEKAHPAVSQTTAQQQGHANAQPNGGGASEVAGQAHNESEPHWGDPTRSQVRRDTSRRERLMGIVWLSIGALFTLFVSVLYIGSRITIGSASIPFPWTIAFATVMMLVISKTSLLWTDNRLVAGIPLAVWMIVFIVLVLWPALPLGGDTLVPSSIWSLGLMIAGMMGGAKPLLGSNPSASASVKL